MPAASTLTLVLGGARSGKSRHAEGLCLAAAADERVYVATAQAWDDEMRERIARHRAGRDAGWRTVEEPLDLAERLLAESGPGRVVLVECLTLWLTNVMVAGRDVEAAAEALLDALARRGGPVVLVSNEVGSGVVPTNAMARAFVDHAGRLHQAIAAMADRVVLVTAGLPLTLKGTS